MIVFPIKMTTNLGNWMFQYAAALQYGEEVSAWPEYVGADKKLMRYRELFDEVRIVPSIPNGASQYFQPRFNYDPLPKKQSDDLVLWGYYQSEKFFSKPAEIRRRFGVSENRRRYLVDKYADWLNRPGVTGISVRRGDYLRKPQFHPFVGKQFFKDCITRLSDALDYIVCSDDIPWCKKFFTKQFPDKHFLFVEGEDVLNQLFIHSLCKNNIISNSSFSWWGAWLNENPTKRVFAPSHWFGCGLYRDQEAWRDIYFAGVEIIPNRYTIVQGIFAIVNVVYWFARRRLGCIWRSLWKLIRTN